MGSLFVGCLVTFLCRIADMSLGTVRTILNVKGKILIAAVIGFFEAFVWFLVVRDAINSSTEGIWVALSFSAGFACGVYVGGLIGNWLATFGVVQIQVITSNRNTDLIKALRMYGYAVSVIRIEKSEFSDGKYMLIMEISAKKLNAVTSLINAYDANAFTIINESKAVYNGYFIKK